MTYHNNAHCLTCDTKIHRGVGALHCTTLEEVVSIPICCVDDHISAKYCAHFLVQKSQVVVVTGKVTPILIFYLKQPEFLISRESKRECMDL